MKKTLKITMAMWALSAITSAFANNNPPPVVTPPANEPPLHLQLQGQLQGQQTTVDTKAVSNSISGAKSTAEAQGGNASSNLTNDINVDAADRSGGDSYSAYSKMIFIPPVVPATPPSYVGNAQIVKETSACGPLQSIVRTPVHGTFYGVFSTDRTEQGWTEDLAPYVDAQGVAQEYIIRDGFGGKVFYGHQVTMFTTVVGVANARNVAIGGGGTSGNWGQGGTGTSAANQQMVTTIKLRLCEAGRTPPPPAAPPAGTTPPQQPEPVRPPRVDRN